MRALFFVCLFFQCSNERHHNNGRRRFLALRLPLHLAFAFSKPYFEGGLISPEQYQAGILETFVFFNLSLNPYIYKH